MTILVEEPRANGRYRSSPIGSTPKDLPSSARQMETSPPIADQHFESTLTLQDGVLSTGTQWYRSGLFPENEMATVLDCEIHLSFSGLTGILMPCTCRADGMERINGAVWNP